MKHIQKQKKKMSRLHKRIIALVLSITVLAGILIPCGLALSAAGETYIGYSKLDSSLSKLEYARFDAGVGVSKYYLVDQNTYNRYMAMGRTYALQQQLIDESQLAYCFNYYENPPDAAFNSNASKRSYYDETENASANFFYNATSSHRRLNNPTQLYNHVMAVAINGYSNNASRIQEKYGLTDDQFRVITQYAIWYWTDSISIKFTTSNGSNVFYMYADDTNTWLSLINGSRVWYPLSNNNLRLAYEELVNSTLPAGVTTEHINVYKNRANGGYTYQNLLTVGKENDPLPEPKEASLEIEKTVTGNLGDRNKYFNFRIEAEDGAGDPVTGTFNVTPSAISGVAAPSTRSIYFNNQGVANVRLKHGQKVEITGLPAGFYYEVVEAEANQDGYTTTSEDNSNMMDDFGVDELASAKFVNNKEAVPEKPKLEGQITARKTLDGNPPPAGQFTFILKDEAGRELERKKNEADGTVTFTRTYTDPGTYKYTIEELKDDQPGIIYDESVKEVTVVVTEHDLQVYDESKVYYGWDKDPSFYEDFVIDSVPGGSGIQMFCTNQNKIGPSDTRSPQSQTYMASINPSPITTGEGGMIYRNIYGSELETKLKKLFCYLQSDDANQFDTSDKQKLVWSATGVQSNWVNGTTTINGQSVTTTRAEIYKVLDLIYQTTELPAGYNLVFFQPTGSQLQNSPQTLATGYGPRMTVTGGDALFENTTEQPANNSLKLTKTVSGTDASRDTPFNFTIQLRDENYRALTGTFTVTPSASDGAELPGITSLTFDAGGTAQVQLKHGQSIQIEGLPDGFLYTIMETEFNQDGYTTTLPGAPNSDYTGVVGTADVIFNNHRDKLAEYSLKVLKNREDGAPLSGAGFKIFTDAECTQAAEVFLDADKQIALENAQPEQIRTDERGELRFYGLKEGTYYLKEVRSPTGYTLLADPVTIVVDKDGKVTVNGQDKTPTDGSMEVSVTVTDMSAELVMPSSGYAGTMPLIMGGAIAAVMAIGGFIIFRRKRRKLCRGQSSHINHP